MTDKDIEVIVKPIFTKMFKANFSACEYGIECYKKGMESSQLAKAKEIMQKLITNAPNTYSGTNIELQQKKMFSFQDAVNKAEKFLNS